SSEGDMPKIALSTGSADALECLLRKIGIDDSEITSSSGSGKVHLYVGNDKATAAFDPSFVSQGTFAKAESPPWDKLADLTKYDIVILSCEGSQPSATRAPNTSLKAVYDYANMGGRVFLSHWHNYWIEKAPQVWPSIVTFTGNDTHIVSVMPGGSVDQTI